MKLNECMNVYLANQQIMFVKLHNLHWYIKGENFFSLHAKFEDLYDSCAEIIDEVAERMLMIGHTPVASLASSLKLAKITELADKPIKAAEAVKILHEDVLFWIDASKNIHELANKEGDFGTADIFAKYLGEYQKLSWMLKSTMSA
ncbi:MAG: DNA starvation/stationary phase protection protein [Clostridiales bacterium]|jgi:starvation-inducible DNA-binding protein|nr:DNA starvation/stationary phase protection protein [Clostridiales bacterium]